MTISGEYGPSTRRWVREQVERYEGSGGTEGTMLRGVPVIVVTMVGVRSGKVRKVPLMRVEYGGSYAVVASDGGAERNPVWYHNLRAHPKVEVQDGPVKRELTARELSGGEKAAWWERAVGVWPDYAAYQKKTDRQIPVFVLEPTG